MAELQIPATTEDAARQLARCKVAAAQVGGFHKVALGGATLGIGLRHAGKAAKEWLDANPQFRDAMAPVAIGAGIGGVGGLALGATSKRKVNPLWTALSGATLGAAGGGLYSAVQNSDVLSNPKVGPGAVAENFADNSARRVGQTLGPGGEYLARRDGIGPIVRGLHDTIFPEKPGAAPMPAPREAVTSTALGGLSGGPTLKDVGRDLAVNHPVTALGVVPTYAALRARHIQNDHVRSLLSYGDGTPKGVEAGTKTKDMFGQPAKTPDSPPTSHAYTSNGPDKKVIHAPANAAKLIDELTNLGAENSVVHPRNLPGTRGFYEAAILKRHMLEAAKPGQAAARAAAQAEIADLNASKSKWHPRNIPGVRQLNEAGIARRHLANMAETDHNVAGLRRLMDANVPQRSNGANLARAGGRSLLSFGLPYMAQQGVNYLMGR